jgi:hypothetical protein
MGMSTFSTITGWSTFFHILRWQATIGSPQFKEALNTTISLLEPLSNFDFTLEYIHGKDNVVADVMSRPVGSIHMPLLNSISTAQANDLFSSTFVEYLSNLVTELPDTTPAFRFFSKYKHAFVVSSNNELSF